MTLLTVPVEPLLLLLFLVVIPIAAIAWDSNNTVGDYGMPLLGFLIACISLGAGAMYALTLLARWVL